MPPKKSRGLGRGLDALLPVIEAAPEHDGLAQLNIIDIDPNPNQPRRTFDPEALHALAQSIQDQGILQPLLVAEAGNGRYTIVAGERRWRAAREAGLETVPCIVRDMDTLHRMEAALIENLQREDLNPIEEAAGIRALMDECGYTQEQAAQRLGKSRPAVANLLRLLNLPDQVQQMVKNADLSAGHARVLAGLDSRDQQLKLAQDTVLQGYSVRQLETIAAELAARKDKPEKRSKSLRPVELTELEDQLRETLGLKTTLTGSLKRGRIVLNYYSEDELQRLYDIIGRLN